MSLRSDGEEMAEEEPKSRSPRALSGCLAFNLTVRSLWHLWLRFVLNKSFLQWLGTPTLKQSAFDVFWKQPRGQCGYSDVREWETSSWTGNWGRLVRVSQAMTGNSDFIVRAMGDFIPSVMGYHESSRTD